MVRVKDILSWIDSWAPFRFAESWDNCGLQVGSPDSEVNRVLVALDPGSPALQEARELGCECIVTHHPLLLKPIQTIRTDSWPGRIIAQALISGINIVAAHTNLDAARQGTNAQFIKLLDLTEISPLESEPGLLEDPLYLGMGIVGTLPRPTTFRAIAEKLGAALGGTTVRMTGDPECEILRTAVCTGSGASLIAKARAKGADLFITGDMKYHDCRLAEENGLAVLDIGHFASEKLILGPLAAFIREIARKEGATLEVFVSKSEEDPFQVVAGKC